MVYSVGMPRGCPPTPGKMFTLGALKSAFLCILSDQLKKFSHGGRTFIYLQYICFEQLPGASVATIILVIFAGCWSFWRTLFKGVHPKVPTRGRFLFSCHFDIIIIIF